MAITADFRHPFYFLSLQLQIYLLFPLIIKSSGGYLQVYAVLYYVQNMKIYFSVKCWTFYQVDILQKTFWMYFIYCYDKMLQKIFLWTLKSHIIWYWSNCEAHWFWLSGFLLPLKENSYTRIAHAAVQEERQQGTWEPKIKSGNNEDILGTFRERLLSRISFFFPCIREGRANKSRKTFIWPH